MNVFKKITIGSVVLAGSIYMSWAWAETAKEPNVEYIKFSQQKDGEGKSCIVEIKTGKTNMEDTACKNDVVSFFQLNNVPSATFIYLASDKGCRDDRDWMFRMKTIVHPTTTIWLSIPDLKNKPDGEIIVKGLRMIENDYSHGNIEGKLSCVEIVRSALP